MSKRPRVDFSSDSESDEEALCTVDRTESFWKGAETHKIGFFKIRLYFDPEKFAWVLCFVKNFGINDVNGKKPSHVVIPGSDIPSLAAIIRSIARQLKLSAFGTEKERQLYVDNPDDYKKETFWNKSFCMKTPSGRLILRPFKDQSGGCSIRMLSPKSSKNFKDWMGTSVTWGIQDSLEFANLLGKFQKFIKLSDDEFQKVIKQSPDQELDRPSPTEDDLNNLDDVITVAAVQQNGKKDKLDENALEDKLVQCKDNLDELTQAEEAK